jgi:hypothetical protein
VTQHLPSAVATFPFVAGLMTKGDKRAKNPPQLDICVDVEFDDLGGLRTRYPFAVQSGPLDVFGGSAITGSEVRRVVENGDELLLFTKSKLYSRNVQLQKWIDKGTHLAVKVDEQSLFTTTGDQIECDRAELSNTIVCAWRDASGVYVAAKDKTTGAVTMAPTRLPTGATPLRPRLVALSTKILLFTYQSAGGTLGVVVRALDPADVATGVASAATNVITGATANTYYDVTRVIGTDTAVAVCRLNPTTSYTIATITSALTVATSTKARDCTGPIAVASHPLGTHIEVVRVYDSGTVDVLGDYINLTGLADVFTSSALGTIPSLPVHPHTHVTCAFRSTQDSSQYRCYAFWSFGEYATTGASYVWDVQVNWVDTNNTIGTAARISNLGIVSRAFDHEGRVFVWLAFAQESSFSGSGTSGFRAALQNTNFLYRDDLSFFAKATSVRAAGFIASYSHLPGVQNVGGSTYAWVGGERRIIELGAAQTGFGKRAPREITFEFDSNEARRCARLGNTLYVSGGEILQYDSIGLTEVGFHIYPWYFFGNEDAAGANIPNGSYAYKPTYRWENAMGELDRSTTATVATVTIAGGPSEVDFGLLPCFVTHKTGTRTNAAIELWRTKISPTEDAPFYLVTSKDPAAAGDNGYVANDPTVAGAINFTDDYADATIANKESNPENGAVLENLAPPPASIIVATDTRLFLGGVAGDPDRVWYSKQRVDGEVASFHDTLVVNVPPQGGAMTALAFLNETLVVFRETAIYLLPGDGFDNTGGGSNFGPTRVASLDVGAVTQEGVVQFPEGLLFKSSKGWYVLNRAGGVQYIGTPIAAYDDETPIAAHTMESQHQVRILTSSRMLVLDYLVNPPQWGEWSVSDGEHACMWQGSHVYLSATGVKAQQTTYDDVDYGWDVETAWIKVNELQGRGIVRAVALLGEYRAAHSIRYRAARNYEGDGSGGWSYFDDRTVGIPTTTVGGQEQLKFAPSIKRPIQAFKVRLTAMHADRTNAPSGDTARLTGLSLEVAAEPGLYSGLSAAQKV